MVKLLPLLVIGFRDIIMMWVIIASSFGISEVVFGNSSKISSIIYKGELDVYILQPKPILPNLVSSRMVMLGWRDALFIGFSVFLFYKGLKKYESGNMIGARL